VKKVRFLWILALGFIWMTPLTTAEAAYSSHQNDQDISKFLEVYPFARSTKLDDCSLCHPGGKVTEGGKTKSYGSCDYCHITYGLQPPHGEIPFNGYGQAYKDAGRSQEALQNIEGLDSDGDSYGNLVEIRALSFPGDKLDHPGLTPAPAVVMNQERILDLPHYNQLLLANASKSMDEYVEYRGARIGYLLSHVGLRPEATQITVFAPDGFSKTFPLNAPDPQIPPNIQYDVMGPYPQGYYYGGLDFVNYSYDPGYPYDGYQIPDRLYMLLGYLRNGDPLEKGRLVPDPQNPGRLVLEGEGPYRLILPQKIAGGPDRPSTMAPLKDGWDYDPNKDHNWGSSVRSVTAIRVEPLPPGSTDFKWTEGGWNLVDKAKVAIYGAIKPETCRVTGKVTDSGGNPLADVQISFGLVSLGQVGKTTSGSTGKFRQDLPAGEYVAIPSKPGYIFHPESIAFQLPGKNLSSSSVSFPRNIGYKMNFTASPVP